MEAAHLSAGQAEPRWSSRSVRRRWSGRSRSRPTSAPGSRSSTRCARRCSRSASASSPGRPPRSSRRLLRRAPARVRLHVERARGGAALRRRHRAPGRLLSRRPDRPDEVIAFYREHVGPGRPPEVREQISGGAGEPGAGRATAFAAMCEVAQRFAGGSASPGDRGGARVRVRALGRPGLPDVAGEAIPLPARLLHVARDISLFLSAEGATKRGPSSSVGPAAAYDPRLAELARARTSTRCSPSSTRRGSGTRRSRASRSRRSGSRGTQIDAAFGAIAALTGLKSPWLREHSTGVAELAEAAAWRLGLGDAVELLRRAALAHDLGRVGVSNAIWEKPGPLGFGEWERVRLHPHFTERAFAQSSALAPIGLLAGSHHERLDGSGYHRGRAGRRSTGRAHPRRRGLLRGDARGAPVPAGARRPRTRGGAEARGGRGGSTLRRSRPCSPPRGTASQAAARAAGRADASASSRCSLALVRGQSNQGIADELGISAKTVGHHVQHVYQKAGVRSRAAATVWAFENELVHSSSSHRAFARCAPGAPAQTRLELASSAAPRTRRTR